MPPLNNEQITALKKKATLASVSLAITLSLLKTFGALYTGSLSVLTSMIDSLADIFASSVTYIAVKVSSKPASRNHRYGYGKAEALSALIQSAFVAGSGIFVLYDGISRLITPRPLEAAGIGIIIMVISLISTLALIMFQKRVCRITLSQAICADSAHYTVDVITNAAIILTLIMVKLFDISWFDTLTAFVVSSYLLINAYKLARDAVAMLLDHELPDSIRDRVREIVLEEDGVRGMHDLRTRDLGGAYLFEFHLELDGNLPLYEAHEHADRVEAAITHCFPGAQVIIHEDPAGLEEDRLDHKICGLPGNIPC